MTYKKPCSACFDGSVWNSDGPTGQKCKVCDGHAVLNIDGSKIDPYEEYDDDDSNEQAA